MSLSISIMVGLFVLAAGLLQKMLIQGAVAGRFRIGDPDAVHVLTGKSLHFFGATPREGFHLRRDKLCCPGRIDKFIIHSIFRRLVFY